MFKVTDDILVEVFQKEYKLFFSICYAIVNDKHNCEDVIQDVFEKTYTRQRINFKSRTHFINWIAKICKNQSISFYRKNNRTIPIESTTLEEIPTNDKSLEETEMILLIQTQVGRLPLHVRDAIYDITVNNYSVAEVCRKYKLSRATVRHWKKVFLKRIKVFF